MCAEDHEDHASVLVEMMQLLVQLKELVNWEWLLVPGLTVVVLVQAIGQIKNGEHCYSRICLVPDYSRISITRLFQNKCDKIIPE